MNGGEELLGFQCQYRKCYETEKSLELMLLHRNRSYEIML